MKTGHLDCSLFTVAYTAYLQCF